MFDFSVAFDLIDTLINKLSSLFVLYHVLYSGSEAMCPLGHREYILVAPCQAVEGWTVAFRRAVALGLPYFQFL